MAILISFFVVVLLATAGGAGASRTLREDWASILANPGFPLESKPKGSPPEGPSCGHNGPGGTC
ncbi:hypothetical protein KSP39_PZI010087 [Platanthera zijinensis]|uniref:Uncharacterized protein n=1 Tax=Platanthera zijinensis TaxID=2320716 RepID=A0AAP0G6M1_9ASPA